jgi:hypothetical protein
MRFSLGQVVATRGALAQMERLNVNPAELIERHTLMDRGALDADDHERNQQALVHGDRIFSSFEYQGIKFWVITEWDRSVTTVLLPEEY